MATIRVSFQITEWGVDTNELPAGCGILAHKILKVTFWVLDNSHYFFNKTICTFPSKFYMGQTYKCNALFNAKFHIFSGDKGLQILGSCQNKLGYYQDFAKKWADFRAEQNVFWYKALYWNVIGSASLSWQIFFCEYKFVRIISELREARFFLQFGIRK